MWTSIIQQESYKPLFRFTADITVLHSEHFIRGTYGNGDPVIIYKDGVWNTFINKDKEKKCLKDGYDLYRDAEWYKNFASSFREFSRYVKEELKPGFTTNRIEIAKPEFEMLLKDISKLFYFYGFMEYFYTDLAFEKNDGVDTSLARNIKDFEKLKFEGRNLLNDFIFKHGIIPNALRVLSGQFFKDEMTCNVLFSEEILNLFKDNTIDEAIVDERKQCYALAKFDEDIQIYNFSEAQEIWSIFVGQREKGEISGTIANTGKASGKVVIAPMMTDMEHVQEVVSRMKKGDILVAHSTTPELISLCNKAAAIVTDQGGMLSHAAIVSRELNVPCVIGTGNATEILKDGDFVEVDADMGVVRIISQKDVQSRPITTLSK